MPSLSELSALAAKLAAARQADNELKFAGSSSGFDIGGFDPDFGAGYTGLPTQTAASSGGVPKRSPEVKPLKPEMPNDWEDGPCWLTWCVLGPF